MRVGRHASDVISGLEGRRAAGFSLIEALIVLIVAGFALMLVFAIGGQAARTGFALGRRAR